MRQFILQANASGMDLGFVLSQIKNKGEEHPLAFGSKKLLPCECNYLAIECEALPILMGIQHFHTYLEGMKFKIEMDYIPHIHMSKLKDSHSGLARWALALQPFDYTVAHRSGHANANADGLSRDQGSHFKGAGISGINLTDEQQ